MKTNSLQKGSRPRERYGFYAAAVLACIIFIIAFAVSSTIERGVQYVLSPLWQTGSYIEVRFSDFFSVFFSRQALFDQNASLQSQIAALQAKVAGYDALSAENAELSAALGRKPKQASFAAAVILRPPELPYDTFLLDLGTRDGIASGDTVLGPDGIYLGTISEAYDNSSKALLASSSGIQTKALAGSAPVTFTGKGGGSYEGKIPQAAPLAEGDSVRVSGGDFTLGKVAQVVVDANNAYRNAVVSSGINLSEIRYVFIAKPSK